MTISEIDRRLRDIEGTRLASALNDYFENCAWPDLYKFHTEQAGLPKSGPLVEDLKGMSFCVFLEGFIRQSGRSELQ